LHIVDVLCYIFLCTPGSMHSLFSDFFRELWRGILGGVRDYVGEVSSGKIKENSRKIIGKNTENSKTNILLDSSK